MQMSLITDRGRLDSVSMQVRSKLVGRGQEQLTLMLELLGQPEIASLQYEGRRRNLGTTWCCAAGEYTFEYRQWWMHLLSGCWRLEPATQSSVCTRNREQDVQVQKAL